MLKTLARRAVVVAATSFAATAVVAPQASAHTLDLGYMYRVADRVGEARSNAWQSHWVEGCQLHRIHYGSCRVHVGPYRDRYGYYYCTWRVYGAYFSHSARRPNLSVSRPSCWRV